MNGRLTSKGLLLLQTQAGAGAGVKRLRHQLCRVDIVFQVLSAMGMWKVAVRKNKNVHRELRVHQAGVRSVPSALQVDSAKIWKDLMGVPYAQSARVGKHQTRVQVNVSAVPRARMELQLARVHLARQENFLLMTKVFLAQAVSQAVTRPVQVSSVSHVRAGHFVLRTSVRHA